MKYTKLFIGLLTLITSCDIVIDLDLPEHTPVLVVNSVLSTDSSMTAYISHSKGAFDNSSISSINDARVMVYEDGTFVGEMDTTLWEYRYEYDAYGNSNLHDTLYKYVLDVEPKSATYYSYEITHPDFKNVSAEVLIPNDIQAELVEVTQIETEYEYDKKYRIRLRFNDEAGATFYRLFMKSKSDYYSYHMGFETSDPSIVADGGAQTDGMTYWGSDALFDDRLFENEQKEIAIDIWHWEESGQQYVLNIASISREYYLYLKSLRAHESYADEIPIFSPEPVQVYTNINDGLGVLGGMAVDSFLIQF